MSKVIFVGAGPGDPELITVKGKKALEAADIVIYAGSLVSKEVLDWAAATAELVDSAGLTLEEIVKIYKRAAAGDRTVVRLHSGDPSIYGAIGEQIDCLVELGVDYEIIPGVTAAFAAAAAIGRELTMPEVSQTVIIARAAGRTSVPPGQDIATLAQSKSTLCLYLSIDKIDEISGPLGRFYEKDTPVAVVYRASRSDQRVIRTNLAGLAPAIETSGIRKTAIVIIGPALAGPAVKSKLYDKEFTHGSRSGS